MLLCPISAITFCCAQLSCTNFASCAKSGSMGRQSQSQICVEKQVPDYLQYSPLEGVGRLDGRGNRCAQNAHSRLTSIILWSESCRKTCGIQSKAPQIDPTYPSKLVQKQTSRTSNSR